MLSLILGGARAGKSDFAERLAILSGRPVVYVATMEPGDDELRARIERHRARRPAAWRTIEAPRELVDALANAAREGEFVIVDCLTLWVTNLLLQVPGADWARAEDLERANDTVEHQARRLLEQARSHEGEVALVSNEVGLGVVPPYPLGRVFRDALGAVNRLVAAEADETYLLVAGVVLPLRRLGGVPLAEWREGTPRG